MTRHEMESLGFTYAGTCHCDGTTNIKYEKGGYLFYIRPKRNEFHVKKDVNYLKKHISMDLFDEEVKKLL